MLVESVLGNVNEPEWRERLGTARVDEARRQARVLRDRAEADPQSAAAPAHRRRRPIRHGARRPHRGKPRLSAERLIPSAVGSG
jgi:hypothetical protein